MKAWTHQSTKFHEMPFILLINVCHTRLTQRLKQCLVQHPSELKDHVSTLNSSVGAAMKHLVIIHRIHLVNLNGALNSIWHFFLPWNAMVLLWEKKYPDSKECMTKKDTHTVKWGRGVLCHTQKKTIKWISAVTPGLTGLQGGYTGVDSVFYTVMMEVTLLPENALLSLIL